MNNIRSPFILCLAICFSFLFAAQDTLAQDSSFLPLETGWQIQSAASTGHDGVAISTGAFSPSGWHAATVPTTVLGALVNDGVYTNIFFGTNLARISRAPFTNAWWFRNEFSVTKKQAAGNADLVFEGINYRANVWLNGKQIADMNDIFGAFKIFTLDAGGMLK